MRRVHHVVSLTVLVAVSALGATMSGEAEAQTPPPSGSPTSSASPTPSPSPSSTFVAPETVSLLFVQSEAEKLGIGGLITEQVTMHSAPIAWMKGTTVCDGEPADRPIQIALIVDGTKEAYALVVVCSATPLLPGHVLQPGGSATTVWDGITIFARYPSEAISTSSMGE